MKCPKDGYDLVSSEYPRRADRDLPPLRRHLARRRRARRGRPRGPPGLLTRVLSDALEAFRSAEQTAGPASDRFRGRRRHRSVRLSGRTPGHPRGGAGAQPQRARVRAHRGAAGPHADAHRARRLLRALVGALLLQALQAGPQDVSDHRAAGGPGAGRERRRAPAARRLGGRLQDRVPQPSLRGRALSGRGDRRRRHPARRLHHGRAPGRGAQQPPVRAARRAAQPLPLRRRRARRRRLRQLRRRPDARRRGRTSRRATPAIRWSTRCASGCCAKTT